MKKEYEDGNQDEYIFYAQNRASQTYHIKVTFSFLTGLDASTSLPFHGNVKPGRNRIFELKPKNTNSRGKFQYSFSYGPGCIKPKVDEDIVYQIPLAKNKVTQMRTLDWTGERLGKEKPDNWYSISFSLEAGDTIFCARKGIIVEAVNNYESEGDHLSFTAEVNSITIEHDDCTYGRYKVFQKEKIFVSPGEIVYPGDPLGIGTGEKYLNGAHVRFSTNQLIADRNGNDPKWQHLKIKFRTEKKKAEFLSPNEEYKVVYDPEIIAQEMSRRIKKKRGLQ